VKIFFISIISLYLQKSSSKFDIPKMIKLAKRILLAMAFICLFISCSIEKTAPLEEANYVIDLNLSSETDWQMADEILLLINEHRTTLGLSIIEKDQQYASAYAVKHTKYMIDKEQINHDNFPERSQALMARGAIHVGENVAKGYYTAEEVVYAWLNSPHHREVIEGPYTNLGFGVLRNTEGLYYFTLLFYK